MSLGNAVYMIPSVCRDTLMGKNDITKFVKITFAFFLIREDGGSAPPMVAIGVTQHCFIKNNLSSTKYVSINIYRHIIFFNNEERLFVK